MTDSTYCIMVTRPDDTQRVVGPFLSAATVTGWCRLHRADLTGQMIEAFPMIDPSDFTG